MKLEVHKGSKVTEPDFFRKIPVWTKLGKKGPKWPKNGPFQLYFKFGTLVFFVSYMKLEVDKGSKVK